MIMCVCGGGGGGGGRSALVAFFFSHELECVYTRTCAWVHDSYAACYLDYVGLDYVGLD